MRWMLICVTLLLGFHAINALAQEETERGLVANGAQVKRIALVIGNSAYKDSPLRNPVNDARDMAATLRKLGFDVIEKTDASQKDMNRAIAQFGEKLRSDTVALFFYAGHGVQVRGKNYIIPVDAHITSEATVRVEAVDVDSVMDQLTVSSMNIIILDACRNNPFERRFRSISGGLAQMDAPKGSLIAYATAPGKTAADGNGRNGLYTQELLKNIQIPGLALEAVFKRVRNGVMVASGDAQTPWESSSLTGDFYFLGPTTVQLQMAAPVSPPTSAKSRSGASDPTPIEVLLWESAKTATTVGELQAYLTRYPNGFFADMAKARITAMSGSAGDKALAGVNKKVAADRAAAEEAQRESRERAEALAAQKAARERADLIVAQSAAAEQAAIEARRQAAAKKRTEEQPAITAATPPTASTHLPNTAQPVAQGAEKNSVGYTVGDKWQYQRIDKWKNTPIGSLNFRVDKILANGNMEWNGGAIVTAPDGGWLRDARSAVVAEYSPKKEWLPKELRVGAKQDVNMTVSRQVNGAQIDELHKGTLVVRSKEAVKVPAGEFNAYKIQVETEFNMPSRRFGQVSIVLWYVPELRNYAAYELAVRSNGTLTTYERQELTSFVVTSERADKFPAQKHLTQSSADAAATGHGQTLKDCSDCPEMVVIPGGRFDMGGSGIEVTPIHKVNLQSFAMGRFEVTQGQWQAVMGSNPSHFTQCGANCPVENVSWDDAQAFIQKLNIKTGKVYRLPSESEWEYACRAGGRQEYCGNDSADVGAPHGKPAGIEAQTTNRVGGEQANAWGLYDMSGNVMEWTQDCWNESYIDAPSDGNAWMNGNCRRRVARGGSWSSLHPGTGPAAYRSRFDRTLRVSDTLGFRLARMLP